MILLCIFANTGEFTAIAVLFVMLIEVLCSSLTSPVSLAMKFSTDMKCGERCAKVCGLCCHSRHACRHCTKKAHGQFSSFGSCSKSARACFRLASPIARTGRDGGGRHSSRASANAHELAGIGREHVQITWTHLIEKVLLKFKELEHVKTEKPSKFFGTSSHGKFPRPQSIFGSAYFYY